MSHFELTLESPVATSFRCTKAANSLDIDQSKKAVHHFEVDADLDTPYNVGLIVGASGSGKTTLAKQIWGADVFTEMLDLALPVIDQFDERYSYDECAAMLAGVGLTSVVCWIRPAYTLSNGQRVRAELALRLSTFEDHDGTVIMDEWTSVVDRTVGKVMSHCIQKHARRYNRSVVLLSCHYDVIEWLDPDWIIDCNKQSYVDRRSLQRGGRQEKLHFDIRPVGRDTWPYFSKYHYLSERLPGGLIKTFGLFCGNDQVGFQCFANYTPRRRGEPRIKMHSNRTVIHPDYAGLGMGIALINKTSKLMTDNGYDVWAKYSSTPVYLSMKKYPFWKLRGVARNTSTQVGVSMMRRGGYRTDVKTYSFQFDPAEYQEAV